MKIKVFIVLIIFFVGLGLASCGSSSSVVETEVTPAGESGTVSVTLQVEAPGSTAGSLSLKGGSKFQSLSDAAVSQCDCVLTNPVTNAVLKDSDACQVSNGTVTVKVDPSNEGLMATCLLPNGGYVGTLLTSALTEDTTVTLNSVSTASLALTMGQVEEAAGASCFDAATGKATCPVTFLDANLSCFLQVAQKVFENGDVTLTGGKKCAGLMTQVIQNEIAQGGNPSDFLARLFDKESGAMTTAEGFSGLAEAELGGLVDLCKSMKDLSKASATDSTCGDVVDHVVATALSSDSTDDLSALASNPSLFNTTLAAFTPANLNADFVHLFGGVFDQGKTADNFASLGKSGALDAIKKVYESSSGVSDWRSMGRAVSNTLVGGIDPAWMAESPAAWANVCQNSLSNLGGKKPPSNVFSAMSSVPCRTNADCSTLGSTYTCVSASPFSRCQAPAPTPAPTPATPTPAAIGATCTADTSCGSSYCLGTASARVCAAVGTAGSLGFFCDGSHVCGTSLICSSGACVVPLVAIGAACTADTSCGSSYCLGTASARVCAAAGTAGSQGSFCDGSHVCGTSLICSSGACVVPLVAIGAACTAHTNCASSLCGGTSAARVCVAAGTTSSNGGFCDGTIPCGTGLSCSSQACAPAATSRLTNITAGGAQQVAADSSTLYFIENSNSATTGQISSINIADSTATRQILLSNLNKPTYLALNGSTLYWASYSTSPTTQGGIFRLANSVQNTVLGINNSCFPSNGIAVDAATLYFDNGGQSPQGSIKQISALLTDQTASNCSNAATSLNFPQREILAGDVVFFITGSSGSYAINKLTISTSVVTTVVSGITSTSQPSLAVDGTNVCWGEGTSSSQSVTAAVKCHVNGTTSTVLTPSVVPNGVEISGSQVYVSLPSADSISLPAIAQTGNVVRVPVAGGASTTLVSSVNPTALKVVGNNVCFFNLTGMGSTSNSIMCAAK